MAAPAAAVTAIAQRDSITAQTAAGPPAHPLTPINPYLHIYDPSTAGSSSNNSSSSSHGKHPSLLPGVRAPAVILLFGFMDGPLRILAKYAAQYQARFPSSTLVLQLSTGTGLLAAPAERTLRMRRIVAHLERAHERAESRRALRTRIRALERSAAERSLDSAEQRRLQQRLRALQRRRSSSTRSLSTLVSSGTEDADADHDLEEGDEDDDGEDEHTAEEGYLPPEERTPHGLLIHSFSDGGARNLWALLNELSSSSSSSSPDKTRLPPVRGLILDSSPGLQTASTPAQAFTMPLRKKYAGWIVWLAKASVWIWVRLALFWRVHVRRLPTDSERMRAALNNPAKWGWGWWGGGLTRDALDKTLLGIHDSYGSVSESKSLSTTTAPTMRLPPRLYLYSRADVLIPWAHVESHGREAAQIQSDGRAEAELVVHETGDDDVEAGPAPNSTSTAKAKAEVDAETARWAALSAKFDSSFASPSSAAANTASAAAQAPAPRPAGRPEAGVRLVRWERALHCDLGRHDVLGYWGRVDAWLSTV